MANKKNRRKPRAKQAPRDSATDQPQPVNNRSLSKCGASTAKAQQKAKASAGKIPTVHLPLPDREKKSCYQKKVNKYHRMTSKRREDMDDASINPWASPPGQNEVRLTLSQTPADETQS